MTPWDIAKDSESSHQKALFAWANCAAIYGLDIASDVRGYTLDDRAILCEEMAFNNWMPSQPIPSLSFMFAIPNGGKRDPITAARMKGEGVKPGVPDIMLPVSGQAKYCGLFIELKKPSAEPKKIGAGGVRESQTEYHKFLIGQGYCVRVAYSWLQARDFIIEYLNGN